MLSASLTELKYAVSNCQNSDFSKGEQTRKGAHLRVVRVMHRSDAVSKFDRTVRTARIVHIGVVVAEAPFPDRVPL